MEEPCSLLDALKSLSSPNYGPNAVIKNDLIQINFLINEKLGEELNQTSFAHYFQNESSVRITFRSTDENSNNKIFWRLRSEDYQESFYKLYISEDVDGTVTENCQKLIDKALEEGQVGILSGSKVKKTLNVQDLGDENGFNLLILAVMRNQPDVVKKLLKYNFDVDCEFKFEKESTKSSTAIDKAWEIFSQVADDDNKRKASKVILSLLKSNSKYPEGFKYENASPEIKQFADNCRELHELVKNKNTESLKEKVKFMPHLCYIYDENNQSLKANALKSSDLETFNLLSSLDLSIGAHEIDDLQEFYETLEKKDKREVRNQNQESAKEFPAVHLFVLKSKSKIGNNDKKYHKHYEKIEEAFKIIDRNEGCRKVLKIAAACKRLKIFFDFKHDSTYYFDPATSIKTSGITYDSGVIEIGAKGLLDEEKKFEVIGVLIHELTHLAVLMIFMNDFDPYQMGESEEKRRFEEEVKVECEENLEFEEIVWSVFDNYDPKHFNSELIVRPYHMMMHYYGNAQKLAECEQNYPQLFRYVREVVEPELEKTLPILKKLQNDDQEVKFSELTEPMKEKILNKKINFQCVEISLLEIINDEEILEILSTEKIKNILLSKRVLEIGDVREISSKYAYVERNFKNEFNTKMKFEKIKTEIENSKAFLLSGKAGEGKTRTFEDLTQKLKKEYKIFWVSFIKLRKFRNIFEKFNFDQDLSFDVIFHLFCNILFERTNDENFDLDSDFEVRFFKKLFLSGKVILLLDGVDEISPQFNAFIVRTLNILKNETKNQFWVSTRPQHVQQLQCVNDIKVYGLEPYEGDERSKLIENVLQESKMCQDDESQNALKKLEFFFLSFRGFNNPLLIIIITELFADEKIELKLDSADRFSIYETLIREQVDKKEKEVDSKDRCVLSEFQFMIQVLALKFMFDDDQINNLAVMKKWKGEKENWTAERIQRFGFVIVDLNFLETDDKNSIDFIHYSYAEFFVTKFIIDNIFDEDKSDAAIEKIFNILKILEPKWNENSFLLDFLRTHWNPQYKILHEKLKELVINEIKNILREGDYYYIILKSLSFWCPFLKSENETLRELWQVNQNNTLLNKILFANYNKSTVILDLVVDCLGENWHEILNKRNEKLKIDYKIEDNEVKENPKQEKKLQEKQRSKRFFLNFYKLLILVQKDFNSNKKQLFRSNVLKMLKSSDIFLFKNYFEKSFKKILEIYQNDEEILLLISRITITKTFESGDLNSSRKFMEEINGNDREKIRKVLISKDFIKLFVERIREIKYSKEGTEEFKVKFKFYVHLLMVYKNSLEEIQILFDHKPYLPFPITPKTMWSLTPLESGLLDSGSPYSRSLANSVENSPKNLLSSFEEFMKMIFNTNSEKLVEYLFKGSTLLDAEQILFLESLLLEYYNNDEILVKEKMHKILFKENHEINYVRRFDVPGTIKFHKKYQSCEEEFKNFFQSPKVLHAIVKNIRNLSYPVIKEILIDDIGLQKDHLIHYIYIYNDQLLYIKDMKFESLVNLLEDLFCNEADEVKKYIKKIFPKFDEIVATMICSKGEYETSKNIMIKYFTTKDLQKGILSPNVLLDNLRYCDGSTEVAKFAEFVKEVLNENKEQLMDCEFGSNAADCLIEYESYFNCLETFLNHFYENDENQVRKFIRRILLHDKLSLVQLFLNAREASKIKHLRKIYTKYTNPEEELQKFFFHWKDLLKILLKVRQKTFPGLQDFLLEIFPSNTRQNFWKDNCCVENISFYFNVDPQRLVMLEEFLTKFFENNEDKVKRGMRCALFRNIWFNDDPLLKLVEIEELSDMKTLIILYKKYKNSWEELQNFFLSEPFNPRIFRLVTDETYLIFKEFISDIFNSNKKRLCEINFKDNCEDMKDPTDSEIESDDDSKSYDSESDDDQYFIDENEKRFKEDFKNFLTSEKAELNDISKKSVQERTKCICML